MRSKKRSPEHVAAVMLKDLGVTGAGDLQYLEELAWKRGAMVRYRRLDGSEARLTVLGRKAIITVSDTVLNPHRRRFSIAHELGHLEMCHREGAVHICTTTDLGLLNRQQTKRSVEGEANSFASALLMPTKYFQPLCGTEYPSLDCASELAQRFNVSLTAAALRFIQFRPEACAIVSSVDGRIAWYWSNQAFKENRYFVKTKVRLAGETQAAKGFEGIRAENLHAVPATAWLNGNYSQEATIFEQSWYMRNYNSTLTLLWVYDDFYFYC